MEFYITELMNDYIDDEFSPAPSDMSAERIRRLVSARLNVTPLRRTRKAGRVLLVAAVIALALSAAAVAAYQLGLKDMVLSEQGDGYVDVSALGWRDTPEYQAFVEWDAYVKEYDKTHEIPHEDDPSIPAAYLRAGAWSPEMVDALDGILAKYGLTMHDNASILLPAGGSGIDVDAILTGYVRGAGGYAYADGTMMLEVDQTLADGAVVEYQMFSAVKGTFTNISVGMESEYEEWIYTAADGTEVSLVMGEHASMIVADLDRVFVTVHTVFRNVSSREALEALADSIRWTELDACEGFTDEYYAAYRAERESDAEEADKAWAARQEIGPDWPLADDILLMHVLETEGRSSADSGDGSVWVEWSYIEHEGEGIIRERYERPVGDIAAAFEAKLMEYDMTDAAIVLADVPVYVRTESVEGADTVTEYRDFTVYIDEAADGSATALWLDETKDLIFTLTAEPGELTREELEAQISYLLGGREPYPMAVAPEVVWARLGHYEPTWLPEGWYLEPEIQFATSMTADGAWSGQIDQPYITGEVGKIIWFGYGTAPAEMDAETLIEAFGYTDDVLEELGGYVIFTETTVNGHPALLKELNDRNRSPSLLWIDEDAGVLFTLNSEASADAETIRAIAESVALQ